ncbi:unnamed protein product [Rotaria sordida]|uniref:Uncharacterized protein n=1 Tax=Rotaria sordida TaxID=392033 RepID=A0A819MT71_9BILA|nr:unnamed protein product [Rotaria sordida]CAF0912073.1 unnamed protein product [Rotaria sordida]CAF0925065.1 unnamed protein product [Rotaria sordida]CAF0985107.1 unnamed protein product [Rotaria sordida]CAF1115375.1 unnamed protein product [Rotaria sordida]
MNTNNKIRQHIVNLTTTTTTSSNGWQTISTHSPDDDHLRKILAYAIPLSCFTIVLIVVIFIGIRQRRVILEKWISLKRMRNTNPKFLQNTGLRRDSEFDSYNHDHVKSKLMNQKNTSHQKPEYPLETIA